MAEEPKVISITKGEAAPFTGVLMNPEAVASTIVSSEKSEEKCKIKIESDLDLLRVRHLRDLEIKDAEINFCEKTKTDLLALQDEYIKLLERQATKKRVPPEIILGIGVVAGVGLTVGAGYAIGQAANGIQ